ncbi:EAL domain-containing protein [Photobacterium satsumensis]|uniref:EAL domain-containing protein n=1 Tax=Photobacterium satsumensis TaxID=2910239 RepID=UPI003D0CF45C
MGRLKGPSHIKEPYFVLLSWLIILAIVIPLIALSVIRSWQNDFDSTAKQIDAMSEGFNHDITTHLEPLNLLPSSTKTCNSALIVEMQKSDFKAKNLTNFALVKNNKIICTTNMGTLSSPLALKKPNWITDNGVKVILDQDIPIFGGDRTGHTVQKGDFLAFLDYQRGESQTEFPWLKYRVYGLVNGKTTYSYGTGGFQLTDHTLHPSGRQWYESGHWLSKSCSNKTNSECKVIAIDIQQYFESERNITFIISMLVITILMLTTIYSTRLHAWLYSLSRQVRVGLTNEQLTLNYQPIFKMNDLSLVGCEVLCRWSNAKGEVLWPDQFFHAIEQNNQTRELTTLVVTKCIKELSSANLLGKYRVAINAFPDDIASGHLIRTLCQHLPVKSYSLFTIELTEQQISNLSELQEGVRQLRGLGFNVAIDDFGTGFSNLEGLRELSVDTLKIDKSFVWGAETPSLKQSLINHIVSIAKSMGLSIVAEGVETQQQLNFLRQLEIDFSQGYLHSKPLSINDYAGLVREYQQ